MHRITGAGLYFGTILLAWWLIAASTDARAFDTANGVLMSFPGRIVLFGFTWALFHHLFGGIRHFIWDTGRGMEHPEREYLAQATLIGGFVLSVAVWVIAYMVR
jgi:succinate dehydrogenase / fumarate reductase cytochrome b subunit